MHYIITHRGPECSLPSNRPAAILHVGPGQSWGDSCLYDSTGDNISEKNPYYCELTGMYWIWKNGKEEPDELVGIEQYRRFFIMEELQYLTVLGKEWVDKFLEDSDIIVPRKDLLGKSVRDHYAFCHRKEDLEVLERIVRVLYPDCSETLEEVLQRDWIYTCNMMICRKSLFDRYCGWLFPILFAAEKEIDVNAIDDTYQKRVFGFLSERLFNVWLLKENLICKELPILKI